MNSLSITKWAFCLVILTCTVFCSEKLSSTKANGTEREEYQKKADEEQRMAILKIESIFNEASSVEILVLDPIQSINDSGNPESYFHQFKILDIAPITELLDRAKILDAYLKSIRSNTGMVATCFSPHHGLRIKSAGKTIDLVICFKCFSTLVYGPEENFNVLNTGVGAVEFEEYLNKKGIPLKIKTRLKTLSEAGDPDACFDYASLIYGRNPKSKVEMTEYWGLIKRAAEQGHPDAVWSYSEHLLCIPDLEKNKDGFLLLKKFSGSNKNLKGKLANCYESGKGTEKNMESALKNFQAAEDCFSVAKIYEQRSDFINAYIWMSVYVIKDEIGKRLFKKQALDLGSKLSREEKEKADREIEDLTR